MQVVAAAALTVAVTYWGMARHRARHVVAGLAAVVILAAVISGAVVNLIPLPTNEVIVTATGEKNENAANNEVYIVNYLVGGKEYAVQPPTEGKWFWKGNAYMWRNENDPRQPAGTTRSVTLNIPYGKDRRIQFGLSQWNGIVEVTYGDDTNRYDLFKTSEKSSLYVPVPDTEAVPLYGIKLLRLALYTAMILLLSAYPALCAIRYSDGQIATFWGRHWDKLVYIALAAGCFAVMFETGKEVSLWIDELWSIGWIVNGYTESDGLIWYWLYKLWYHLMPYGQEYLLIISEILVVLSIYTLGMIGRLYKSKRLGILMATLGASSMTVMTQCGGEFRNYSILLFAVALTLYLFVKKQRELPSPKLQTIISYSVALVLCMDSHRFGLVTAGLLMLFDFVLIIIKKAKHKNWAEFFLPAAYGIYWISNFFTSILKLMGNFSIASAPNSPKAIISAVSWLCSLGKNNVLMVLLILGGCMVLVTIFSNIYNDKFDFTDDYILLAILLVPCLLISINYFYSTVINPNNSLWIARYMMPTVVFFNFLIAIALDKLIEVITLSCPMDKSINSSAFTMLIVIYFCITNWNMMPCESHIENDYRAASNYLMAQNEIYLPSTLCYVTNDPHVNIGFDYYLTQGGKRDSINHISNLPKFKETELSEYKTIYVVSYRNRSTVGDLLQKNGYVEDYNNGSETLNVRKWVREF